MYIKFASGAMIHARLFFGHKSSSAGCAESSAINNLADLRDRIHVQSIFDSPLRVELMGLWFRKTSALCK